MFASVPTSIPSPPISWANIYIPLGWVHNIIPGISDTYRLDIKTYALCLLAGMLVAVVFTSIRLTSRGGEPGRGLDIAIVAIVFGIIGARAYHVLTHWNDYFGPGKNTWNPFEPGAVWNIWDGGIAIFGSIIGGYLMRAFGFAGQGGLIYTIFVAVIGAVLLTAVLRMFNR